MLGTFNHNRAETRPDARDSRLRGRKYTLPFAKAWGLVLQVAHEQSRWTIVSADPAAGEVHAEARTALWRSTHDVQIRLSLDTAGLTRVDLTSASRSRWGDFGIHARRIARFLQELDLRIERTANE